MSKVKLAAMNKQKEQKRILKYVSILRNVPSVDSAVRSIYDKLLLTDGKLQQKSLQSGMLYVSVFAPALMGFVEWVIEQAVTAGKDRIYFLSRDGWQMYLIACKLVEARKLKLECRYLNVSRYSMKLPAYHFDIEKSIESMCVGGIDVTAHRILERAGLNDDECREILGELGSLQEAERILNYHEVIRFREKLKESRKVRKLIYVHSKAAYDTAAGYLVQEGLCRDGNYYIVDSGWIGTLQCAIEVLVKSVSPDVDVEGCYFGMYEYPKAVSRKKFHTYYFSPEKGLNRKSTFSNSLFETIVSSDEGMTTGYEKRAGKYVPIKSGGQNPNYQQINDNISLLEQLLDIITFERNDRPLVDRGTIYRLFRLLMAEPTGLELASYGDSRFSDNVLDDACKSVAAQLDIEQIKNQHFISRLLIIAGVKKAELHESAWIEGSAVRLYGDNIRKRRAEFRHIRFCKGFIYLRKQMKA